MAKTLFIHSSPRGAASASRELAHGLKIGMLANGHTAVVERDVAADVLPHIDEHFAAALRLPRDALSERQASDMDRSDALIAEIFDANTLVFSTGMYNFSVSSTLKTYLDHIARVGRTFQYGANGPEGLLKGKKAILILTSGGVYSTGPFAALDFVEPYLRAVLGFMGVTDVVTVRAEGLSLGEEAAEAALSAARAELVELAKH